MIPENNSFCVLPWIHLYLHQNGAVNLCCIAGPTGRPISGIGHVKTATMEEIWNSELMNDIRLRMLAGEPIAFCENCYNAENLQLSSGRIRANQAFGEVADPIVSSTLPDGSLPNFELKSIDFRFNNLCNFKCRMCFPDYSSRIAAELIKIDTGIAESIPNPLQIPGEVDEFAYNEFKKHYNTIREIYFAGGEPLIQENHWKILEDLVQQDRAKDIKLIYTTNGSTLTFNDKKVTDYWAKFSAVNVLISLDAEGKAAEYWRDGTKWTQILMNLDSLNKLYLPNVFVGIISSIGWPNVFSWIRLVEQIIKGGITFGAGGSSRIRIQPIRGPREYSLVVAPKFKKAQIEKALDQLITDIDNTIKLSANGEMLTDLKKEITALIGYMNSENSEVFPIQFRRTMDIDKERNLDFFDAFPEHEDMRPYFSGLIGTGTDV